MARKRYLNVLLGLLLSSAVCSADEGSSGDAEYTIEGEFIRYEPCSSSMSAGFRLITTLISAKDVREISRKHIQRAMCSIPFPTANSPT